MYVHTYINEYGLYSHTHTHMYICKFHKNLMYNTLKFSHLTVNKNLLAHRTLGTDRPTKPTDRPTILPNFADHCCKLRISKRKKIPSEYFANWHSTFFVVAPWLRDSPASLLSVLVRPGTCSDSNNACVCGYMYERMYVCVCVYIRTVRAVTNVMDVHNFLHVLMSFTYALIDADVSLCAKNSLDRVSVKAWEANWIA